MTEEQIGILNLMEIHNLIERLKEHATVAKITGYVDAALDTISATDRLNELAKILAGNLYAKLEVSHDCA